MTFLYKITLRNEMVARTFNPSFDNRQMAVSVKKDILLRSRNFATMVT